MVLQEDFIAKKNNRYEIFIIFLVSILLFVFGRTEGQSCIDTVHIKGYFIVKQKATEIDRKMEINGDVQKVNQPIDARYDPSFIPCDSISRQRPLSYWLNIFFQKYYSGIYFLSEIQAC